MLASNFIVATKDCKTTIAHVIFMNARICWKEFNLYFLQYKSMAVKKSFDQVMQVENRLI